MPRRERMDDAELAALVSGAIADARQYGRTDFETDRDRALQYAKGEMRDIPAEVGKSSVTSRDLSDVLGWIMPGLLRVFLASDRVAVYEPNKAQIEVGEDGQERDLSKERADQATDYVNHVFLAECAGYSVLQSVFQDGLLLGNGIVKHWWDDSPEEETHDLTGLVSDQLAYLMESEDVRILQHRETDSGGMIDEAGLPVMFHDVKIARTVSSGRLRVEALPPEEFLIERNATALDNKVRFCAHYYQTTRSELIERGYDREMIEDLSAGADPVLDSADASRGGNYFASRTDGPDKSTELVDVYECYVLCDYDGDGIAERRRIVMAGGLNEDAILENEEWEDDLPFTDIVPDPIPHRWKGRSLFDEVADVQRVKTVLMRQMLDNLYMTNNPMTEVVQSQVVNMDALINRTIGANIFVKQAGAIKPLEVPFTADKSFTMLEYCDSLIERRTGISRSTMALDMDALANQTATATNAATAAAATKVETYARNIAEAGLKRLFRSLLKLIVAHQDRPRTIRLRGKWTDMDPRAWEADMDVSINTGLGSGSRDRDVALVGAVLAKQELIIQTFGPDNPICPLPVYRDTLAKAAETAGFRQPEMFFKEVGPAEMQKWGEAQGQKPDPKVQEAQARLQLEAQKAQFEAELETQKRQAEIAHRERELVAKANFEERKAAAELQAMRDKAAAEIETIRKKGDDEIALAYERSRQEMRLKEIELHIEGQLKEAEMRMRASASGPQATNIEEARPQ